MLLISFKKFLELVPKLNTTSGSKKEKIRDITRLLNTYCISGIVFGSLLFQIICSSVIYDFAHTVPSQRLAGCKDKYAPLDPIGGGIKDVLPSSSSVAIDPGHVDEPL